MCSTVSLEPRHRPEMSPDNPNNAVIHNNHHYDGDNDTSCDLVCKQINGIDKVTVDTSAKGTQGNSTSTTPFFEGVEKNLEVWFTNSSSQTVDADLRNIPRFAKFHPIKLNHF